MRISKHIAAFFVAITGTIFTPSVPQAVEIIPSVMVGPTRPAMADGQSYAVLRLGAPTPETKMTIRIVGITGEPDKIGIGIDSPGMLEVSGTMRTVRLVSHVQRTVMVDVFASDTPARKATISIPFGPPLPEGFIVGPMGNNLSPKLAQERDQSSSEQDGAGTMNLTDAQNFCSVHGGQLPSREELLALPYPLADWPTGKSYWTREKLPSADGRNFTIDMTNLNVIRVSKEAQNVALRVTCVRPE